MHEKHGAFYLVRKNKWTRLAGNKHDALVEYARLTAGPDKGAMGELMTKVLADLKLTVAASTLKHYGISSRKILDAFVEFSPQQVKPKHIARFLDDMKATPSAANHCHALLRNMFKRAVRWGVVESDPTRDIEQFKVGGRDRLITDKEWNAIRKEASPTMQCLMDIAYITGQRKGDVMAIKYSDISESGVFIKQQKTKTRRLIEMTPDLSKAIEAAKALHPSIKGMTLFHKGDGKPLSSTTMYGHWRRACDAAGVVGANFHDIRAGTATDADEAGMDSQSLLGHTTESSHKRYLRSKKVKKVSPLPARNAEKSV